MLPGMVKVLECESIMKRKDFSLPPVWEIVRGVGGKLSAEVEVEEVKTSQHIHRLDDGICLFGLEVDP